MKGKVKVNMYKYIDKDKQDIMINPFLDIDIIIK